MGVLALLGNSSLMKSGTAERGVLADRAESSEGKVAVTGVVNCASFGLVTAGMVMVPKVRSSREMLVCWRWPQVKRMTRKGRKTGRLASCAEKLPWWKKGRH